MCPDIVTHLTTHTIHRTHNLTYMFNVMFINNCVVKFMEKYLCVQKVVYRSNY